MKKLSSSFSSSFSSMTLAAVLCCAMTATTLTACGNDKEEEENKPTTEVTPTMVAMTFTFNATADMVNFFDMVITYNDGTGEKQETMTGTQWTKTVTVKLPASFSFSRQCRVKTDKYDAMAATPKVTITSLFIYSYDILDAQGKVIPGKSGGNDLTTANSEGSGKKVADRANEGGYDKSYAYSFDVNGRMTSK